MHQCGFDNSDAMNTTFKTDPNFGTYYWPLGKGPGGPVDMRGRSSTTMNGTPSVWCGEESLKLTVDDDVAEGE